MSDTENKDQMEETSLNNYLLIKQHMIKLMRFAETKGIPPPLFFYMADHMKFEMWFNESYNLYKESEKPTFAETLGVE